MSENTKSGKSVKSKSVKGGKRGRKALEIKKPASAKFTVADVITANPTADGFICRATADKAIRKWRRAGEVGKTKETLETGEVGKPATIFAKVSKTAKAPAKTKTLASAPAVDVAPAPVAEPVAAPVAEPVAEAVTA